MHLHPIGEARDLRRVLGSGIFTTSGFVARDVGSAARLMGPWLAGGLIAFAGALSCAEVGAAMPEAGGEYAPAGKVVAIAALWSLTAIQVLGLGPGATMQRVLTAGTVVALVTMIVTAFALGHGTAPNFVSSAPAHGSVAVSLIFILWAYSGWNAAAYLAGEVRDPRRISRPHWLPGSRS